MSLMKAQRERLETQLPGWEIRRDGFLRAWTASREGLVVAAETADGLVAKVQSSQGVTTSGEEPATG